MMAIRGVKLHNKFSFVGGKQGLWQVTHMSSFRGAGLEPVERVDVVNGDIEHGQADVSWVLNGLTSNVRYATRKEMDLLKSRQPVLNRPEAICAALIPIRKSALWWDMPQDERRAIFEETSHHTKIGLDFL